MSTDDAHTTTAPEREILEERAARLAQERAQDGEAEDSVALLTFRQGPERYALPATDVAGVFRLEHLTPLPSAPDPIAGITSWRGHLLNVLDLERVLGLERTGLDDRVWVVVVEGGGMRFGVLGGRLETVVEVPRDSISPSERAAESFSSGTTDEAVLVLDASRLATSLAGATP